jgi:hypothetical protein
MRITFTVALLFLALLAQAVQTIKLKEYIGHTWSDELISYPLDAELAKAPGVTVTDAGGKTVPCQVKDGRVYLLVTLPADGELAYTITPAPAAAQTPDSVMAIGRRSNAGETIALNSGVMMLLLPGGEKAFPLTADQKTIPGPILGISQGNGAVVGRSWFDSPLKVTGYKTTVTASGPLFAEATVDYTFEGDKHYKFTARVIKGQPTAIIDETMDLNPGGKYIIQKYPNDADASSWEWWNLADSDHLGVVNPNYPRANVVFSLKDGLQPNQARWTGGRVSLPKYGLDANGQPLMNVESGEAYIPISYAVNERVCRIAGWWLNSFSNYAHSYTAFNDADPTSPAVSFSTGRASRNVNPNLNPSPEPWIKQTTGFNDLGIWTRPATKDLQIIGPICLGSREWLLTVEPQTALPAKGNGEWTTAFKAHLKYGRYPLEKIKDWSFDWPEPQNAWPRLFCKAGDLAGMQARVQAAPASQLIDPNIPAIYKKGGTPEQMGKQALAALKPYVDGPLNAQNHGSMNWFHASLHMMSLMPTWEAAMATPGIDPKTRAKIKAYGAFIAQRAWDEDYWPPKETQNGWGSANMGTLASTARVLTASAMAGMPGGETHLRRCRGYLDGNLIPLLADDGSAVSCPHYIGASMQPILYMALALKYGGGYDAFKADPRMARYGQFMMDILTPPDPRSPKSGPYLGLPMGAKVCLDPAVNRPNLWPLGNTSRTEPTSMLDMLALGYQGVNDTLAGELMDVSRAMGSPNAGGFIPAALLTNPTAEGRAPTFTSKWYPSYGVILRDKQPLESWFAMRYSTFAFDHFEAETGAFSWFAKGVPLMMGFGNMYSPDAGQPIYRSRVAWDIKEGPLKPCPGYGTAGCFYKNLSYFEHKFEPWTCKTETYGEGEGPTESYGKVTQYAALPAGGYVQGETVVKALQTMPYYPETPEALKADPNQKRIIEKVNPFTWQRRVLFATNLKHDTHLLVRDDFLGTCPPPTVSYWVMADELMLNPTGAFAKGQFGVDLDIHLAQPANPVLSQTSWEHKNWGGEKQLCLRVTQRTGMPVLALLYPRAVGEPVPAFSTIANGNGVKIFYLADAGTSVEYNFLALEPVAFAEGAVRFQGSAGQVATTTTGAQLLLPAGGMASCGTITLETDGAVGAVLNGKQLTVQTSGAAQNLRLSGSFFNRDAVTIDGKRVAVKKGMLTLAITAGEKTLVIE